MSIFVIIGIRGINSIDGTTSIAISSSGISGIL